MTLSTGDLKSKVVQLTFNPTGDESFSPSDVGFSKFHNVIIEPTKNLSFEYDYTNEIIKAYGTDKSNLQANVKAFIIGK